MLTEKLERGYADANLHGLLLRAHLYAENQDLFLGKNDTNSSEEVSVLFLYSLKIITNLCFIIAFALRLKRSEKSLKEKPDFLSEKHINSLSHATMTARNLPEMKNRVSSDIFPSSVLFKNLLLRCDWSC